MHKIYFLFSREPITENGITKLAIFAIETEKGFNESKQLMIWKNEYNTKSYKFIYK